MAKIDRHQLTREELQADADAVDDLWTAASSRPLTLDFVQRIVARGTRAAIQRIATRAEESPGVLEAYVACMRPDNSCRNSREQWSRAGAVDGATQAWAGVMVPRGGCPTPEHAELYSAHWSFAAAVVARVRSERT